MVILYNLQDITYEALDAQNAVAMALILKNLLYYITYRSMTENALK